MVGKSRGSHTSTMPVNSRTGTQVMWIATLTCAVSKCALLAMGIRPMYGIAMVRSVLVLSQLSSFRGFQGWMWMLTKSNCFSRLSAILPGLPGRKQKDGEFWGKSFAGDEIRQVASSFYRKALSGAIDIQDTGPGVMWSLRTLGLGIVTAYIGFRCGNHHTQTYQTIYIINFLGCPVLRVMGYLHMYL